MIITGARLRAYAKLRIEQILEEHDGQHTPAARAAIGGLVRITHALDEKVANSKKRKR